jgi:hypothetical protein
VLCRLNAATCHCHRYETQITEHTEGVSLQKLDSEIFCSKTIVLERIPRIRPFKKSIFYRPPLKFSVQITNLRQKMESNEILKKNFKRYKVGWWLGL